MSFFRIGRRLLHLCSQHRIFAMDPLNAEVYELKGQIFRRNVPLERTSQVSVPSTFANIATGDDIDDEDQVGSNVVIDSVSVADSSKSCSGNELGEEGSTEIEKGATPFIEYDSENKCYHTSFEVPLQKVGSVIGSKGCTKKKLEKTTNCKLVVDKTTGIIEISADSSDNVRKCKDNIQSLVDNAGSKSSPTHFVSVELSNEVLQKAYIELIENIRTDENISEQCQERSLFRPVEKLHLTISVLRLLTEQDKETVKKCIEELFQREIRRILEQEHEIPVHFDGLDFFGNGPSKANVIFARIVSDRLQKIANMIDDALVKTGLAEKRRTEDVKLHLTLINTKNAKKGFKYRKINASALLKKFGGFKFDSVMVNEVRICSMRSIDPTTRGYQAIYSIKL